MNPTKSQVEQNRKKWLAVLRNPVSTKQKGALASATFENRRCCLGHACHALEIKPDQHQPGDSFLIYNGESVLLPPGAAEQLNITHDGLFRKNVSVDESRCYSEVNFFDSLVELNDKTDLIPAEIATFIEAQFEAGNLVQFGEIV